MAGGRVGNLVFANPNATGPAAANDDILVTVFLRGGCDGLSLVAPYDDPIYVDKARPTSRVDGALEYQSAEQHVRQSSFGLHPSASPLKELYDAGQLAIVHRPG